MQVPLSVMDLPYTQKEISLALKMICQPIMIGFNENVYLSVGTQ
jgi:hypothetical protein